MNFLSVICASEILNPVGVSVSDANSWGSRILVSEGADADLRRGQNVLHSIDTHLRSVCVSGGNPPTHLESTCDHSTCPR